MKMGLGWRAVIKNFEKKLKNIQPELLKFRVPKAKASELLLLSINKILKVNNDKSLKIWQKIKKLLYEIKN